MSYPSPSRKSRITLFRRWRSASPPAVAVRARLLNGRSAKGGLRGERREGAPEGALRLPATAWSGGLVAAVLRDVGVVGHLGRLDNERAVADLELPDVDAVVVISPHARKTGLYHSTTGSLAPMGRPDIEVAVDTADDLIHEAGRVSGLPLLDDGLDHGIVVPLRLRDWGVPVAAVGIGENDVGSEALAQVTVALEALDEKSLVRILKEPKNALTKQYQKLFDLEDVKLTFEESALRGISRKALKRGTGARGLRAILEELMTDVMFELPSRDDVVEVKITEPCVLNGTPPLLEIAPKRQKKEA